MGMYKSPLAFPYECPSFLPACAGITISTLRVDDICERGARNE